MLSNLLRWLKRDSKPLTGGRRSRRRGDSSARLRLEPLEDRVVPAFDLTISTGATANVLHDASGHFTATASGANVNVNDILIDLFRALNVTVNNGSTGNETGNITWQAGSPLDYDSTGSDLRLTLAADPSTQSGATVALNSAILDSNTASPDALSVTVQAQHDLTVGAPLSLGSGTLLLQADAAASGSGTLSITAGPIKSTNTSAGAVTLSGADVNLQSGVALNALGVTFLSSVPSRPMNVGGAAGAVAGINLTDAELNAIQPAHNGALTFGDATQTGDITFTTVSVPVGVSAIAARQNPAGGGKITLDDGGNSNGALAAGSANVTLAAGTGGIVAAQASNATAEIATRGAVTLDTAGGVGTAANRIQFASLAPSAVTVGATTAPYQGVFLDGLDNLTVGGVTTVDGPLDVTARGNLTVSGSVQTGVGAILLGADLKADESGDDGHGTLSIGAGVTVNTALGNTVTLRGADVDLQPGSHVSATAVQVNPFADGLSQPAGLAVNSAGNVFVANAGNGTISKITPQGVVSTYASGLGSPIGLAVDGDDDLYVVDGSGTLHVLTPQGDNLQVASGLSSPGYLALGGFGNLYYTTGGPTDGAVMKVSLLTGNVSTFATGMSSPSGVVADSAGNVYVANYASGVINKVTPGGQVSTFASGLAFPWGLAFDSAGDLLVSAFWGGAIMKVTPQGVVSTLVPGLANPSGLAVDGSGKIYFDSAFSNWVHQAFLTGGSVVIRSSIESRPMSLGGADNAVAGINLTDAELAALDPGSGGSVIFGDAGQTGNITFTTATPAGGAGVAVVVQQNPTGPGKMVLNEDAAGTPGTALDGNGNSLTLQAGTGGIVAPGAGDAIPEIATTGPVTLTSAGGIGSGTNPIQFDGTTTLSAVSATLTGSPSGIYLDGLGGLSLGAIDAGSGTVTVTTDTLTAIQGTIHADGGITLRPRSAGQSIGLNGTGSFALTAAELALLQSTSTVTVGGADSGPIALGGLGPINLGGGQYNLVLQGGSLSFDGQLITPAGKTLTLDTGAVSDPLGQGSVSIAGGTLVLNTAGVGTSALPLLLTSPTVTAMLNLGASTVSGDLFLGVFGNAGLTTTGLVSVGGVLGLALTSGDFTTQAGDLSALSVAVTFGGSGGQRLTTGGQEFTTLEHDGTGTLTLADDLTLSADFTSADGAGDVDVRNRTLHVGGDWSWGDSGSLVSTHSTVVLDGTGQRIQGETNFYNLTKTTTQGDTLTFQAGAVQTVGGTLTLQGTAGHLLALRSDTPGTPWLIDPLASLRPVSFVDVKDSVNFNPQPLVVTASLDSGDNTNWVFAASNLTWTGAVSGDWGTAGNWSLGYVPFTTDNVLIPAAAPVMPVLDGNRAVHDLTIQAGASLSLAGHDFTAAGTFTNQGTFVLRGSESVRLASGNDTAEGTWQYVGSPGGTVALADFGPTDYFNLVLAAGNNSDVFQAAAPLNVAGTFTVSAGSYDAHGNTTTVSGLTAVNAGYHAGSGVQTFAGGLAVGGGDFDGSGGAVVTAGLNLTGGVLNAPPTLADSGDWAVTGGTFLPGSGTVDFTGAGEQSLASGGQGFASLTHSGAGPLRLVGGALTVGGALLNGAGAGDFQANNQAVTVGGGTTLAGSTFIAGAAPLAFKAGLTLAGGSFTGAAGPVNAAGVALSSGTLTAPAGTLTVSGDWAVSGTGVFLANGGTVVFDGAAEGLTSGGYAFANLTQAGGTLTLRDALAVAAALNVAAGTLDLNGHDARVGDAVMGGGALSGAGTVTNASTSAPATLTLNATAPSTFAGLLADGGAAAGTLSLVKNGAAPTLTGRGSFAGPLTVNGGAVLVNAPLTAGAVVNGGTLGGAGSLAGTVTVDAGGTITGGGLGTVGLLTVGALVFNGGTYQADLSGSGADAIRAGSVNLAGPVAGVLALNAQASGAPGIVYTLLDNTGSAPLAHGPLSGIAEGALAGVGGRVGVYSYLGGDGNDFTLTVAIPATLTSAARTTFTVGSAASFAVTAAGLPAPSLSASGALPAGITFDAAQGLLRGTPAPGTAGVYPITLFAGSGAGVTALQSFTLTVNEAPTLTSPAATTFAVGAAGTFTVTTGHGFPATTTLSEAGALPAGVTFTDNGDGTATLAGVPAAGTAGTYAFTIQAANPAPPGATQTFTLTVTAVPSPDVTAARSPFSAGIGAFDPATGSWYLRTETGQGAPDDGQFAYGASGWVGVVGDWNGDGVATVGVFDPSTATWYLKNSNAPGAPDIAPFRFGAPGWIPVVGDWGGDGKTGIGVFDPQTGTWYLRDEASAGAPDAGQFAYGGKGWLPVVGDWNGDGITTVGVVDPVTETWYLKNGNAAGAPDVPAFLYGAPGWQPVAGDWDGDGKVTIGVVDPATESWYLKNTNGPGGPDVAPFAYGGTGWAAVAGAWPSPGRPLLLAGDAQPAAAGATALGADDLARTVAAALGRLGQDGVSAALQARLGATEFVLARLPGEVLAVAEPAANRVILDPDAAGHGWAVEPAAGQGPAAAAGPPAGQLDLLTAVMQELGQVAGFGGEVFNDALPAGVSRVLALDAAFAQAALV